MLRYWKVPVLAAIALGVFAAFAFSKPPASPVPNRVAASDQVTVTTTAPLSGTTAIPVSVLKGNALAICLPSNKTTGFQWRMANKPDVRVLIFEESVYDAPASPGLVGRGGSETWTFRAVGRGKQALKMEYARPWEKNVKPAKTRTFSVSVQ